VWVRLIGDGLWWARWLVTALLLAPILAVPVPDVAQLGGWAWGLVILGSYSLVFAAIAAAVRRPIQRTYLAAFDGLSRPQWSEAVGALRRSEIPPDPGVLAAAIRVRTGSVACRRRARQWHRTSRWRMGVGRGLLAAVGFVTSDIRDGVVLAWLALGMATLAVWSWYRSRDFRCHLQQLRAAAKSAPSVGAASADAEDYVALAPQRLWRSAVVAIIVAMAIMPLAVVQSAHTHTRVSHRQGGHHVHRRAPEMLASLIRYDAEKWLPLISKAMYDANITTLDQQAAFLGQIAEESGGLEMVNELPWGLSRSQWNDEQAVRDYFNDKYANMNGNGDVSSGDGYAYRGRGILQITGKANYAAVSEKLYGDDRLVKNPDLLSQPDAACAAAAAYWKENDLNRFILPGQPVTPQQFQDLGSTINTGHPGDVPNNADERVKYWELAKQALGIK
jgi:predicted chitinase